MGEQWLAELKPGDKVLIDNKQVAIVDRVTPTGKIRIGQSTFTKYGKREGDGQWHFVYLYQWTQEREDEIRDERAKNRAVNYLNDFNFKSLSIETLNAIIQLVEKETK
jgi:hypothetical protein